MARRDYYNVLGVPRDAAPGELKRAFRALALELHPDRNPEDPDAARRFNELVEAYDALSDPRKRLRYDRLGPLYTPGGGPPGPEELKEVLADVLGGLFHRRPDDAPGRDLRYTLRVTLEEVAAGTTRSIRVPRKVGCRRCGATGADPEGGRRACRACKGTGRSTTRRLLRPTCAHCGGRGFTIVKRCRSCDGTGRRGREERLKVKVPPGVATGQMLRLRGKGDEGRGRGPAGSLVVVIDVEEHPLFRRRGDDLLCDLPITFPEAVLGAELRVPTIEGATTIRIDPATAPGQLLKLPGRGLPRVHGQGRGDLQLQVIVEIPTRLDANQLSAMRRLGQVVGPGSHPLRSAFDKAVEARSR